MSLPITAIYTALFAILLVPLSLNITLRRIAIGNVAYGDGNDQELRRKIETLGNFSEYVPLGLLLLACFEYYGHSALMVSLFGGLFFLCRILHAIGMLYTSTPALRAVAMMLQHFYFISVGGMIMVRLF